MLLAVKQANLKLDGETGAAWHYSLLSKVGFNLSKFIKTDVYPALSL